MQMDCRILKIAKVAKFRVAGCVFGEGTSIHLSEHEDEPVIIAIFILSLGIISLQLVFFAFQYFVHWHFV